MRVNLKFGVVSDVQKGYVKVFFDEDDIVSDWIPVLFRKTLSDKESWQLETNEHVACVMDECCTDGVCLGAIVNETDTPDAGEAKGKFRKVFSDGTLIEYDKNTHKLTADVKGDAKIQTTGDAEIDAGQNLKGTAILKVSFQAPQVEIVGAVTVNGALTVSGALGAAGGITASGGGGIQSEGDITTSGKVTGSDIKAGAISLSSHVHTGVQPGAGVTGLPQ